MLIRINEHLTDEGGYYLASFAKSLEELNDDSWCYVGRLDWIPVDFPVILDSSTIVVDVDQYLTETIDSMQVIAGYWVALESLIALDSILNLSGFDLYFFGAGSGISRILYFENVLWHYTSGEFRQLPSLPIAPSKSRELPHSVNLPGGDMRTSLGPRRGVINPIRLFSVLPNAAVSWRGICSMDEAIQRVPPDTALLIYDRQGSFGRLEALTRVDEAVGAEGLGHALSALTAGSALGVNATGSPSFQLTMQPNSELWMLTVYAPSSSHSTFTQS